MILGLRSKQDARIENALYDAFIATVRDPKTGKCFKDVFEIDLSLTK
jgi:hypothetical protein